MFMHLVRGDGESARRHREFYDEYLAVMDLTAEFYLQSVDTVFIKHALAQGEMLYHGRLVRPHCIRRVALLTVEEEKDDITGLGQTEAAHRLCSAIPEDWKLHHVQKSVGHYGVFNGAEFRDEIAPRIAQFVRLHADPRSLGDGLAISPQSSWPLRGGQPQPDAPFQGSYRRHSAIVATHLRPDGSKVVILNSTESLREVNSSD